MRLFQKLRERRGETLAETLTALLIVSLSGAVLAAMIGSAGKMNATALRKDAALYHALTAAETGIAENAPAQVVVEVGTQTQAYSVTLSGDEAHTLRAYHYSKPAGGVLP